MNSQLSKNLRRATEIQEYFLELRRLHDWDAEDGNNIGEAMCLAQAGEKHLLNGGTKAMARFRALQKRFAGIEDATSKYEWFEVRRAKRSEAKQAVRRRVRRPATGAKTSEGCEYGGAEIALFAPLFTPYCCPLFSLMCAAAHDGSCARKQVGAGGRGPREALQLEREEGAGGGGGAEHQLGGESDGRDGCRRLDIKQSGLGRVGQRRSLGKCASEASTSHLLAPANRAYASPTWSRARISFAST